MPKKSQAPGCRSAALAVGLLVGLGLVFMAIGLTLANSSTCNADCGALAITLLYAGLPVSAVFGVFFGDLVLAWPLDITFWVVVGFLLARWSENRGRNVLGGVLAVVILALAYGLVLSLQVEIAI